MNADSVRARLKKLANQERLFNEILIRYGVERFLYRLSISDYRESFILKGGTLLYRMLHDHARVTRDIDLLAKCVSNDEDHIKEVMAEICRQESDDGIRFDSEIRTYEIADKDEYNGVRVKMAAYLGKMKIPLQIDIGFSDSIYPHPKDIEFPVLLHSEEPKLLGYPLETVIAEKYQAMISLGTMNSRYKDFYDILFLSKIYKFDGSILQEALGKTFKQRQTNFTVKIYRSSYSQKKEGDWKAFLHRIQSEHLTSFEEVMTQIRKFLLPIQWYCRRGKIFAKQWDCNRWQ